MRKKQFLDWEQIKSIAIIIDKETALNKSKIDEFISKLGIFAEVFYIDTNSKTSTYNDWTCLTKKDKNIWALPSGPEIEKIKNKKFDLTICLNRKGNLYTAYLTALTNAVFKVGSKDIFGELDIVVETEQGDGIEKDLNEIIRYLKMIRTK